MVPAMFAWRIGSVNWMEEWRLDGGVEAGWRSGGWMEDGGWLDGGVEGGWRSGWRMEEWRLDGGVDGG